MRFKMENEPIYANKEGIGTGQTLTDLQEYNKRLEHHSKILKLGIAVGGIIGGGFLLIILWLIYHVIKNNVVNNIVARCV